MSDLYDGTQNRKFGRIYKQETPDILEAFVAFDNAVFAEEGRAIPLKFRELMALSVAFTTQCSFCIDAHTKGAVKAGATDAEIAEAAWIAPDDVMRPASDVSIASELIWNFINTHKPQKK